MNTPVKVLTLVSFFGLIGAYVAYSSGAFSSASGDISAAFEEEYALDTLPPDSLTVIPNSSGLIMSGSKSAVVMRPKGAKKITKKKKAEAKELKIIPSSKSGAIFTPEKPTQEQIVIPSSKSGKIFTVPPK